MEIDLKQPKKSWYLVYTKPRQEVIAQTNLVRQGFCVYLPQVREVRRRQGMSKILVEPLFPRYLFIYLDTCDDNWGPIRSTHGVASLVRFGQNPGRIPDDLIEFLRTRESASGLHIWAEKNFRSGDHVRVAEGSFRGFEGIYLARSSRERVVVLLDILGRQVKTKVDFYQIESG